MNKIPPGLGPNLRRIRAEVGLSASDLARRAGIARGTLNALEAGKGNPTLETLYALAGVLGVSLASLISDVDEAPRVVRAKEGAVVSGERVAARLAGRLDSEVDLYELTVATCSAQVSKGHVAGVIELLIVISGRLRTGPVDSPVELGPGDSVRFAADGPHVYEALADEPVRATLLIRTPST